jgi:type II secretory pathway component PulF
MVTDSGHTLEQALIMASAVSGKGPAPLALDRLRKGDSLYVALKGSPGVLRSFVAQGEITGELPAALGRAAEYYQTRVEESLDDFQRLLEPTAVLVVGGLVALMLLLLMLPMLQLARGF